MKSFLILFLSLFLFLQNLVADEKEEVKNKFLSKIDNIILIIENKTLTKDQRNEKIVDILSPMSDFELMAKLSLGKVWRTLNKQNKDKFVKLYVERMKKSYSSKLDTYSNQKVQITKIEQPKPNRIELFTNILNGKEKFDISYKYYKTSKAKNKKDKWLIYDVVILGVSMLKTDRAQFKEFLRTKSINDLMKQLNKK